MEIVAIFRYACDYTRADGEDAKRGACQTSGRIYLRHTFLFLLEIVNFYPFTRVVNLQHVDFHALYFQS